MRKKLLAGVLALVMVAASLVGCGGSSDSNGGTTNSSAGESTTATSGAKELKVGMVMMPQNISPFTNFTNRQPVQMYLYENIMEKDTEGNWKGIIAKDWTTEDNITYDINIYDYVKDSEGNEIKAEDVVFCLEHSRDEAANIWVKSAEVTGDYSFKLTLIDDSASTLSAAMYRAPIVSKKAFEASSDAMATSCVNTAPYKVTAYVPNVSITFEKNDNYWQTDESKQNEVYKNMTVEKLSFTKIAEASQQTIALETGTIDVFAGLTTTEVPNFQEGGRDADKFTAIGYASPISYCFYYANQGICGEDINLRRAIAHAIDKDVIIQGVFNGLAKKPTFYGAPDGMSDLSSNNASEDYVKYDEALAKDYLSKSSYNGEKLRLLIPNEDNHNRIAAIIQGQLMAIGLDVEITSYDNAMFQSNFGDGTAWDISVCQMGMTDPAFIWKFLSWELSGGDQGALGMAVKDEKFDELLTTVGKVDTHNNDNGTKVCDYIDEQCLGQNLISTMQFFVYRKDLGVKDVPFLYLSAAEFFVGCTQFQ